TGAGCGVRSCSPGSARRSAWACPCTPTPTSASASPRWCTWPPRCPTSATRATPTGRGRPRTWSPARRSPSPAAPSPCPAAPGSASNWTGTPWPGCTSSTWPAACATGTTPATCSASSPATSASSPGGEGLPLFSRLLVDRRPVDLLDRVLKRGAEPLVGLALGQPFEQRPGEAGDQRRVVPEQCARLVPAVAAGQRDDP